jgi:signal peptidase II
LGQVAGGTLGNLYDRLGLHGVSFPGESRPALAVRDFLHFMFGTFDWAIFNLADSFLVVGAAMLFVQSFKEETVSDSGS